MYITCQNCDTMYELDEHLLKPNGSKVRCSQCSHVFTVHPTAVEMPVAAGGQAPMDPGPISSEAPGGAAVEKGLDGINLDELDDILDQDLSIDSNLAEASGEPERLDAALEDSNAGGGGGADDLLDDFDLDLDLESDDARPAKARPDQAADDVSANAASGVEDDLNLDDLPLALDDDAPAETDRGEAPEDDQELSLDFDFPMEGDGSASEDRGPQGGEVESEEFSFDLEDDAGNPEDLDELILDSENNLEDLEELILDSDEEDFEELILDSEDDRGALGLYGQDALIGETEEGLEELLLDGEDFEDNKDNEFDELNFSLEDLTEEGAGNAEHQDFSVETPEFEALGIEQPAEPAGRPEQEPVEHVGESTQDGLEDLLDGLDLSLDGLGGDGLEEGPGDDFGDDSTGAEPDDDLAREIAAAVDDGLDLDMDFELEPQADDAPVDNNDLSLESDIPDEAPAGDIAASPDGSDNLDLADLDSMLSEESEPLGGEQDLGLDLDEMDLSLDEQAGDEQTGPAAGEAASGGGDDLDLSDLDNMLTESVDASLEARETPVNEPEEPSLVDEIELAMEDEENLSLAGEEPTPESDAPDEGELLSFDDITPEEAPAVELSSGSDDLDLSDLGDLVGDGADASVEDIDLTPEEQELSLDAMTDDMTEMADVSAPETQNETPGDTSPGDASIDTPSDTNGEISDEIDLIDFEDSPEVSLEVEATPSMESAEGDDDIDLSSLDDILSMDDDTNEHEPESVVEQNEALSSGPDFEDFETGQASSAAGVDESEFISLDEGDFDDLAAEQPQESDTNSDTNDELELSLDSALAEDQGGGAPEEDLTMFTDDGDISLDLEEEPAARASESDSGEELEDLAFELDAEFEDKPVAKSSALDQSGAPNDSIDDSMENSLDASPDDDDADEVDLSDIEEMLEGGGAVEAGGEEHETLSGETEFDLSEFEAAIDEAGGDDFDLDAGEDEQDLSFDLSLENEDIAVLEDKAEEKNDSPDDASILDGDLDLDLDTAGDNEIDDLGLDLDTADDNSVDDLDLEMAFESDEADDENEPTDLGMDLALEDDDELDLSDLQALVEKPKKSEIIDTGDIELEFEIEEAVSPEPVASATSAPIFPEGRTADDANGLSSLDKTITTPFDAGKASSKRKPKPPKQKKGTGKGLVVVLILILLGGGGYLGYDYIVKNNIQIPILSDYINPRPKDPSGILNLSTLDISSKFIENEAAGRMFVISGKVRNGYPETRGMVALRGKLFTKGKVLVKTERTFAGVTMTDQELARRPVQEIKNRLKATPRPQDIDTLMRPGQALPFMLVFSDLPNDLDEFAIETIGSQPVQ